MPTGLNLLPSDDGAYLVNDALLGAIPDSLPDPIRIGPA